MYADGLPPPQLPHGPADGAAYGAPASGFEQPPADLTARFGTGGMMEVSSPQFGGMRGSFGELSAGGEVGAAGPGLGDGLGAGASGGVGAGGF